MEFFKNFLKIWVWIIAIVFTFYFMINVISVLSVWLATTLGLTVNAAAASIMIGSYVLFVTLYLTWRIT